MEVRIWRGGCGGEGMERWRYGEVGVRVWRGGGEGMER